MEDATQQLVTGYQTPQKVINELRPIHTVILVGITGAGKDTIIGDILRKSDDFMRVVTSTTRQPRSNNGVMERKDVDYYFLTVDQARQKVVNGEYIEVAIVHERINGSLAAEYQRIADRQKIALTAIDYQGALNFMKFGMEHLSVYFVTPPNFEIYMARLLKRQGGVIESHDEVLKRFRSAQKELQSALEHPKFIPIMNDRSQDTAEKIIRYAQTGESPSEDERAQARQVIKEFAQSINDYIQQIEEQK